MQWVLDLFNAWRNYRLDRLRLKLDARNKPYDTVADIGRQFMAMQADQTKVLQTWMDSFKITELPKSTVVRDADEFSEEQDRAYAELHDLPPGVAQSIRNAMGVGAEESLMDVFNHDRDM